MPFYQSSGKRRRRKRDIEIEGEEAPGEDGLPSLSMDKIAKILRVVADKAEEMNR